MSLADELLADLEDENDNDDLEEKLAIKDEPIDDDAMDTKEHSIEIMDIDVSVYLHLSAMPTHRKCFLIHCCYCWCVFAGGIHS